MERHVSRSRSVSSDTQRRSGWACARSSYHSRRSTIGRLTRGPRRNIDGSIRISGSSMAAQGVPTVEVGLIAPVCLLAVAAARTGTAGVARINQLHLHPFPLRLVLDKA